MNLNSAIFSNKPKVDMPVIEKVAKRMISDENESHLEHVRELLSIGLNMASAISKLASTSEDFPIESVIRNLEPEVIETAGAEAVMFSDGSSLIKLPINDTESKYIVERRNNSKKLPTIEEKRTSPLSKKLVEKEIKDEIKDEIKAAEPVTPPKKVKKSLFNYR